jgi:hypothetical protein
VSGLAAFATLPLAGLTELFFIDLHRRFLIEVLIVGHLRRIMEFGTRENPDAGQSLQYEDLVALRYRR